MSRALFCLLLVLMYSGQSAVYGQRKVKNYFIHRLDSIVARFYDTTNAESQDEGDERTDPAFFKLFAPTVLYEGTLKRGLGKGFDIPDKLTDSKIERYDRREIVIDGILLNVYKDYPGVVEMTEADMRSVVSTGDMKPAQNEVLLDVDKKSLLTMPDNVQGELKTKRVKPNYWRTSGSFQLDFTQNYFSGNWAQGGENNKTLFTYLRLNVNYKDKKKFSFENTFEAKLGFVTVSGDTLRDYRTNNDMLRIESRVGYQIFNKIDLTAKLTMQTQSMPNYPTNNEQFVSNFMAPFDANFSLGLNYKLAGKGWDLSLFFAPLSSYNYKFVRYGRLASRHGIRDGRHHKEDFGTQLVPKFNATIFKNVSWNVNMEFYTNYARAYFNWENTFNMKINKYLKTTLFLHGRFDDSSRGLYSDYYGYWQFKEYMSLGLTYSW